MWRSIGNVIIIIIISFSFIKCIELDNKHIHAWNGKGCALRDLKRYKEALLALLYQLLSIIVIINAFNWMNNSIMHEMARELF